MYMAQTANIWANNLLKIELELKLLPKGGVIKTMHSSSRGC